MAAKAPPLLSLQQQQQPPPTMLSCPGQPSTCCRDSPSPDVVAPPLYTAFLVQAQESQLAK